MEDFRCLFVRASLLRGALTKQAALALPLWLLGKGGSMSQPSMRDLIAQQRQENQQLRDSIADPQGPPEQPPVTRPFNHLTVRHVGGPLLPGNTAKAITWRDLAGRAGSGLGNWWYNMMNRFGGGA